MRGFDLTDEGYVLVAYQNFFSNPSSAAYLFNRYLTAFTGGIWHAMFGWGGWYAFRVLNAIIVILGYVLICYTLRNYWKYKWYIAISFFLVIINMNLAHGTIVFHYYTFSAFVTCLITYLFYYAFSNDNLRILFVASIITGLNVFVRIPNLTLCVIPFVLLFVKYIYTKDCKSFLHQLGCVTLGILIGVSLVLLLMILLGHLTMFIQSIKELTDVGRNPNNSHGIIPMLQITYDNFCGIKEYTIAYFLLMGGVFLLSQIRFEKGYVQFVIYLLVTLVVYKVLLRFTFPVPHLSNVLLYALAHSLIIIVLIKNRDFQTVLLLTIVFFVSHLQPLGSDSGIGNMGPYAVWGLIPVSIALFLQVVHQHYDKITYNILQITLIVVFIIMLKGTFNPTQILYNCYRDNGLRLYKTYKVQESSVSTVCTSRERSEELNALLAQCKNYFDEGDYVLFASDVPGLHYLTHTKPFLEEPWPRLFESEVYQLRLYQSLKKYGRPIIVVHDDPEFFNSTNLRHVNSKKIVDDFLKRELYYEKWGSLHYKLYK